MLTVIIPTFNEMKNGYIQNIFSLLKNTPNTEVIIVDSFSNDGTAELAQSFGFNLLSIDTTSRAKRLNRGIQEAKGEMLLLHHPRTLLSVDALYQLISEMDDLYWGAFTHKFDLHHPLLKFTSWYSNKIRGDFRHIFYLDHCIFIKKEILEHTGLIPEVDIFEDTELSKILNTYSDPIRLEPIAMTSAIRFKKNGIYKQAFMNQILKWKYYFKVNDKKMNQSYEKDLELNSKYNNE